MIARGCAGSARKGLKRHGISQVARKAVSMSEGIQTCASKIHSVDRGCWAVWRRCFQEKGIKLFLRRRPLRRLCGISQIVNLAWHFTSLTSEPLVF